MFTLKDFFVSYPEPNASQKDWLKKAELYELRPSSRTDMLKNGLYPNQIMLSRMLSSQSTIRGILLYHGVGTGKTCSFLSAVEQT